MAEETTAPRGRSRNRLLDARATPSTRAATAVAACGLVAGGVVSMQRGTSDAAPTASPARAAHEAGGPDYRLPPLIARTGVRAGAGVGARGQADTTRDTSETDPATSLDPTATAGIATTEAIGSAPATEPNTAEPNTVEPAGATEPTSATEPTGATESAGAIEAAGPTEPTAFGVTPADSEVTGPGAGDEAAVDGDSPVDTVTQAT